MIFSVVIPVYNVKDYLPKCSDSVLAQDFEDYEVILIDDGSTDGESGALCDTLAREHPDCIRVLHKPNGGAGDARNVALPLAQGEYVTDVRFEFGTVPSGFSSVVKPTMRVQVLGTVSNGYQIINRADVGGQYLNEWQTAKTTWVTTVRRFNTTPLPKTGY